MDTRYAFRRCSLLLVLALLLAVIAFPTTSQAQTESRSLEYGQIVKWDSSGNLGHTYSVTIAPGHTTMIAVVVLQGNFTPTLAIEQAAGCTVVTKSTARAGVLFCKKTGGSAGTYTLTVGEGEGSFQPYAVVAQITKNGSKQSTTGYMGGADRSLAATKAALYNVDNNAASVSSRILGLTATNDRLSSDSSLAYAVMFREDGKMMCNSWSSSLNTCDIYDQKYDNYHLLAINADNDAITYTLELQK